MTVKIVQKENKILRGIAREVAVRDIGGKKIKEIIKNMAEALRSRKEGVAIAAPQIGESLKIFIVDGNVWKLKEKIFSLDSKKIQYAPPVVFINPAIKKISQKKQLMNEGCLSVEGVYGSLKRAEKITFEALDGNGKKISRGVSGLLAQIVQHEVEHLNGILFIDRAIKLEKLK